MVLGGIHPGGALEGRRAGRQRPLGQGHVDGGLTLVDDSGRRTSMDQPATKPTNMLAMAVAINGVVHS